MTLPCLSGLGEEGQVLSDSPSTLVINLLQSQITLATPHSSKGLCLDSCPTAVDLILIAHPEVAYPRAPCPVIRIIKGCLLDVSGFIPAANMDFKCSVGLIPHCRGWHRAGTFT